MNFRSLTRGDGVVIGAAVLLFIASFLTFYSIDCSGGLECSALRDKYEYNGWKSDLFPVLPAIFLSGVIAAALIVAARFQPADRKVAGIALDHWGTAFAVSAAWSSLWALGGGGEGRSAGVGLILGLIANLAMAAAALLTQKVPALKAPLMGAPTPQVQSPYGTGAHPGYGYPGPGGPAAGGSFGGQPYGAPQPADQSGPQQAAAQPAGGTGGAPAGAQAPSAGGSDFAPFWFAVPVNRPLFPEDGGQTPIAELAPGTWYLAVDQRGAALVAQTQDGRRGVLQDTSGIQRG
ncbi:hypothetical protein J7W19_09475 [Streptomyces mobaraensis NBRC 13819 = DSM 40847]|uniref:hypothetical protein n=1 Tax=Streptomyces mobaraensis TaxID=35621 RepID=UPI00034790B7|nr:hypothetical protein [Streptomyces mobaraensis]QTT73623.1 hypothetical protein J7W19_09475 [Streptomyces mobaraensis NBRC 13819 = DSM 40847]